jgi:hypothetical protein
MVETVERLAGLAGPSQNRHMDAPQARTISEHEFTELCATARARAEGTIRLAEAEDTLRQPGARRVPAATVVLSEIVNELYAHFAIVPNPLNRVHSMCKIDAVMADRMRLRFDYELIVSRCTKEVEQQYGSGPPARNSRRPPLMSDSRPSKGKPKGLGKQDFRRKRP